MSVISELDYCLDKLQKDRNTPQRVKTPIAKMLMLNNCFVNIGAHKRYLRLKNLGLGVYEVAVADGGSKEVTLLIK